MTDPICSVPGCTYTCRRLVRGWCSTHYQRWRRGEPLDGVLRAAPLRQCGLCQSEFERPGGTALYCSDACRTAVAWGFSAPLSCDHCHAPMLASKTSRRTGSRKCRACSTHGLGGYKRGCRCDVCTETKREDMRAFNERVRAEHGTSYKAVWTKRERDRTGARPGCAGGSYWIPREARLEIYERDGWTCHLCGGVIDADAHWNDDLGASLDHVIPRSLGGTDDPDNLRAAHRACNSRRGVKTLEGA